MSEQNDNRTLWMHLRLTPDEYAKIKKGFHKTTCRKLSDYARKLLLGEPVIATYRNQFLDDFMSEMIVLRTELNSIGNNINQAVKRLYALQQIADFKSWLLLYEVEKKVLFKKVEEIKSAIQKIAEQWLQ